MCVHSFPRLLLVVTDSSWKLAEIHATTHPGQGTFAPPNSALPLSELPRVYETGHKQLLHVGLDSAAPAIAMASAKSLASGFQNVARGVQTVFPNLIVSPRVSGRDSEEMSQLAL